MLHMTYKSGNPALSNKTFTTARAASTSQKMTLEATAGKTLILLALCFGGGVLGWQAIAAATDPDTVWVQVIIAALVAFVIALITVFNQKVAPITAPIYAVVEGFALGAISKAFEQTYDGIVLQAIGLTMGIFVSMLLLYLFRIIQPSRNFQLGLASATGGIALYYLASLGATLFFGVNLPLIHDNSPYGIAFSVVVVIVAALNLVVDFDFVEQGVKKRAPKYMEWYAGFGLLVTIVWLYLELLRLLAKIRGR